jgi:hypothetical protein
MGMSIFSASTLMLSLWHIDASVIKQLNHLDKVSKQQVKGTKQDELVLFMLSCLYVLATGKKACSDLKKRAKLLNLDGFSEVMAVLFMGS